MKKYLSFSIITLATILLSCNSENKETNTSSEAETKVAGQSAVQDDESAKDVVKVAAGSKDHTTLVAAVKQAELVDVLSNAGPFTVFAPTNAAFEKLPA
ncbi:MAG: fasciclin domain-containing protein, partial [Flavisolibacter sp.]